MWHFIEGVVSHVGIGTIGRVLPTHIGRVVGLNQVKQHFLFGGQENEASVRCSNSA